MKYTVVISLLAASAAGMPSIFGRQDAVGSAVASFDSLTDSQKADFLEKITQENVANANVQGVNNAGAAAPGSGNGKDVQADIKAAAVDDGQANVAINGSSDIQVKANVQGLDDGIVNLNIEGQSIPQSWQLAKTSLFLCSAGLLRMQALALGSFGLQHRDTRNNS